MTEKDLVDHELPPPQIIEIQSYKKFNRKPKLVLEIYRQS
jgi:hypothetical protein